MDELGDLTTQETTQDQPQDLRSVLESAFDKEAAPIEAAPETETRNRDEVGRFKAKEADQAPETPPVETPPVPPVEAPETPAVEAKRAPSSWKKEAAAEFDKLAPHVQEEILRRESDFHKGIEGFKTHADLGRSMERALQPYMQTIQSLGVSPDVAVSTLLRADQALRTGTPEQKATYLASLARQFGIDIGQAAQIPQQDQYTYQLEQQLQQLRQQQEQFQQSQQEQQRAALDSELKAFAKTAEHFEAVREDMAALLQAGRAQDLQEAYDMAVYANPQTRAALLEQQRQEALKQANAAALANRAKAASVSVRGSSPASGTGSAPTSLRAALEAAYNG